jgi:hypothetical protein
MKKLKLKVHSDKIFAYVAMFSMVTNTLSPFAALIPAAAYAEDVPAEQTTQAPEEKPSEEPASVEEAPKEEAPAEEPKEEPASVSTEETKPTEPAQETTQPEVVVEPSTDIPADTFTVTETVETPVETTPTEPVITEEQPGDILPDGASDFRPEAEVGSSETTEVQEIVDPVATEPVTPVEETPVEVVKEYETLADGVEIKDSVESDWKVDGEKAETNDVVKLGVKYIFPLDKDVSITFPKLDEDRSTLNIERVKVADLNLPDEMKTDAEYAFDVTTGMKDGDFEYDITLPKPENREVEVSYIEKSIEEVKVGVVAEDIKSVGTDKLEQNFENSDVKVNNLNHFTIFVVKTFESTMTTEKPIYKIGEVVYARAYSLTKSSSLYYRIDIIDQNGLVVASSSCDRKTSGGGSTWNKDYNSYTLPSSAVVGTNWKAEVSEYSSNSNCTHNVSRTANTGFATFAVEGLSDLTVVKSHTPVGNVNPGASFSWILTITNGGNASTTFTNSQTILSDNLPNSNATYGSISSPGKGGGTTGTVNCSINSTKDLSCIAVGSVVIPINGTITVTIPVTVGTSTGTLANPRSSGACKVDPSSTSGVITESNENNNTCSETITIDNNVTNPILSNCCGMDVVLVLDSSDSMSDQDPHNDIQTVKNAAITLVNALIPATSTRIGVIDFDTTVIGTSLNPTTNKTNILNKINSIGHTSSTEYTNWDAALQAADTMIGSGGLVVIITDGNPTTSDGPLSDLNDAITHANAIKTSGTRILAIGVDSSGSSGGLNLANLEAIAGPNDITIPPDTITDINDVDVVMGNISQLGSALVSLTTAICGGTVTVNKMVDLNGDGDWSDSNENSNSQANTLGFKWGLDSETVNRDMGTTASNVTSSSHTITENVVSGYSFVGWYPSGSTQYSCSNLPQGNTTLPISISTANNTITSVTLCNKLNTGTITIIKDAQPDNAQDFTFTTTGGLSSFSLDDDSNSVLSNTKVFNDLTPGSYSVTESTVAGWALDSITCGTGGTGDKGNRKATIVITPGLNVTCTFVNKQNTGSIVVHKDVTGPNGEVLTDTSSNFTVKLDDANLRTLTDGETTTYTGVTAGAHKITEDTPPSGYALYSMTPDGDSDISNGAQITVPAGGSVDVYIVNRQKVSTLKLVKSVTNDNGGKVLAGSWDLDAKGSELSFSDKGDSTTFHTVKAGVEYTLSESTISGYTAGSWSCSGGTLVGDKITLGLDDAVTCTITNNDQAGALIVKKVVTNDNGGILEADDFTFSVDGGNAIAFESDGQNDLTVNAGTYTITEPAVSGYSTTYDNCTRVSVVNGGTQTCTITNDDKPLPRLFISKSNDAGGDKKPGEEVTFTINVWVEDAPIDHVVVRDLPSNGFEYRDGSWNPKSISDPDYHSPGVWNVGTINPGEMVELTYVTDITSDIDAGLYKDLAWAVGEVTWDETAKIKATADPEEDGYIGNANFVGTQVNIITDPQPTKDTVDIVETEEEVEGEVLGASTELPATGASTILVNLILTLAFVGGVLLMIGGAGSMLKKRKILTVIILAIGISLLPNKLAYAEGTEILPVVRIEEPEDTVNGEFDITFVAMDIEGRSMTAECYFNRVGEGFVKFDSMPISTGGSSQCEVTTSELTKNGNYDFYVKVKPSPGSSVDSEEVSVNFDGDKPDQPKYIEKDKKSDCKYKIDLKTADNGQTSYVEIYRDSDKEMDLNSGNLIKTHTMGPNEIYEFEDEFYGSDCGKTQYYAVIAFDSAGNASDPRAEEVVTKVTVTTTETTEEVLGALEIPGGANLPGETGAGTGTGETGGGSGSVLGEETTESTKGFIGLVKSPWFWFILIVLAYITARVIKNKNKKK